MPEAKPDPRWQQDYDARTLAEAEAIRSDPKRARGAKAGAARLVKEQERIAKEQAKQAEALKKIAKPKPKAPPKKAKTASSRKKTRRAR